MILSIPASHPSLAILEAGLPGPGDMAVVQRDMREAFSGLNAKCEDHRLLAVVNVTGFTDMLLRRNADGVLMELFLMDAGEEEDGFSDFHLETVNSARRAGLRDLLEKWWSPTSTVPDAMGVVDALLGDATQDEEPRANVLERDARRIAPLIAQAERVLLDVEDRELRLAAHTFIEATRAMLSTTRNPI